MHTFVTQHVRDCGLITSWNRHTIADRQDLRVENFSRFRSSLRLVSTYQHFLSITNTLVGPYFWCRRTLRIKSILIYPSVLWKHMWQRHFGQLFFLSFFSLHLHFEQVFLSVQKSGDCSWRKRRHATLWPCFFFWVFLTCSQSGVRFLDNAQSREALAMFSVSFLRHVLARISYFSELIRKVLLIYWESAMTRPLEKFCSASPAYR